MALIEKTLSASLEAYFNSKDKTEKQAAEALAKIINDHILTASVVTNSGQVVQVAPTTGTGTTTLPGTGSLK